MKSLYFINIGAHRKHIQSKTNICNWKYLKCEANFSKILLFHWKYFECKVNISTILVLNCKYFHCKVNISLILALYFKHFRCTSRFLQRYYSFGYISKERPMYIYIHISVASVVCKLGYRIFTTFFLPMFIRLCYYRKVLLTR